jgi:hypothetical protein
LSISYKLTGINSENELELYVDDVFQDKIKGFESDPDSLIDSIILGAPGKNIFIGIDELKIYPFKKHFPLKSRNLVPNYSFEHDINADGSPDFWAPFTNPGAGYWGGSPDTMKKERGINLLSSEESFSGKYSVKMQGKKNGVKGQVIGRIYGIVPDKAYEFDAAVKTSDQQISFSISPVDFRGKLMAEKAIKYKIQVPHGKIDKWCVLSELSPSKIIIHTPKNCRFLIIYLLNRDKNTIYWDDLYLVEDIENNK